MTDPRPDKPLWVAWWPKDALDGMAQLAPLEELAYRRILDFIFTTNDNLIDDDRALAWMTKTNRGWLRIKARLVALGKIEVVEGRITNERARAALAFRPRFRPVGSPTPRRPDLSTAHWRRMREEVLRRDSFTCRYCAATGVPLDCDHVVPVADGGTAVASNLVASCRRCNRSKGARSLSTWRPPV